jgi:transposase InsO family protein
MVLSMLNDDRFADLPPAEVYATLLDEGKFVCSISTMYRILRENNQAKERRDQLRHPFYPAPELLATRPNELWSWDITKLKGPAKWVYFYLYVILDVFSRYVVGWMVAYQESAALAKRLITKTCQWQKIEPGQLTIHADRGSSMTSKPVALLLSDLGVTKTHGRPHVSNDNPYSESQFKTLSQVQLGIPRPVRLDPGCPSVLHRLLYVVQHDAPSRQPRTAYPLRRPLRSGGETNRGAGSRPSEGVRGQPRQVRPGGTEAAGDSQRGMDQQAQDPQG